MPSSLKRIVIIGRPGSGKSTLALRLGAELSLPTFHKDMIGWLPKWRRTPFATYRAQMSRIVAGKYWIIDGNSPRTYDLRFPSADIIIWLALPRWRCLLRVLVRTWRNFGKRRLTSAVGCEDRFSRLMFQRFLAFDRSVAQRLGYAIELHEVNDRVLILKSCRKARSVTARDLADFLTHGITMTPDLTP